MTRTVVAASVDARGLARRLVAQHTGVAPGDVRLAQTCAACGGPHGRPQVLGLDVHVGWAHSAGLVAVVVSAVPCAVDIESLDRLRTGLLPLDTLHAHERAWLAEQADGAPRAAAFASLWVRKEVLVKLGDLSLDDLAAVDVTPALAGDRVLGRTLLGLDVGRHDAVAAWGC